MLLNLAGGECVEDLRVLEKDDGLGRALRLAETHGMRRRERRALLGRWRRERRRNVPSASAAFRFLNRFHDEEEERRRREHTAFIPAPTIDLQGLGKVNADLVGFVQRHTEHKQATLDMDASLVETHKEQARYCYKKYKAYQPLTTYWAEADLVVHTEFRDGNVPAGHQQLRALQEALEHLPTGVERALMRSDTAGYQQELLRYCAEGRDQRFGVIEFAVGVDVTPEFKGAAAQVGEEEWQDLPPGSGGAPDSYRPAMGRSPLRAQLDRPLQEQPGVPLHRHPGTAAEPAFARNGERVEPARHHGGRGRRLVQGVWAS